MPSRRSLLLGGVALGGAAALLSMRPSKLGAGGHNNYFTNLTTCYAKMVKDVRQ